MKYILWLMFKYISTYNSAQIPHRCTLGVFQSETCLPNADQSRTGNVNALLPLSSSFSSSYFLAPKFISDTTYLVTLLRVASPGMFVSGQLRGFTEHWCLAMYKEAHDEAEKTKNGAENLDDEDLDKAIVVVRYWRLYPPLGAIRFNERA